VPAYFDDAQRQATKDAGKIAGLDVKRIINEPTAAALAYGLDKKGAERIAVYDLGGGTFDISVLEISGGVFSVKSTNGDTHLGGEDFDARIVDSIADTFKEDHKLDLRVDSHGAPASEEAAEKAKHELQLVARRTESEPAVHRDELRRRAAPHREDDDARRARAARRRPHRQDARALPESARTTRTSRPRTFRTWCSSVEWTRMPAVQKAGEAILWARSATMGVNPDEVVAAGAALQGAALGGDENVEVLLLDVTPLSLGPVETGGGVFTVLIPRNTTIPTGRAIVFTTSVDNQSFVPIHVLQGERKMAAEQPQPRALRADRHYARTARRAQDRRGRSSSTRTAS